NGFPRSVEILDQNAEQSKTRKPQADPANPCHIGSTMPAKVLEIKIAVGDKVKEGDVLLITEAMKMEYAVSAKMPGIVESIHVTKGEQTESGDLLVQLKPISG
ncbi:hypothetical protein GW934_01565, partial [Candidatus Falkowbacteria bacterium]|nr:hypothetical protein [Candidatus Falkowbacteria bacterium]